MIRTSRHTLEFSTDKKKQELEELFNVYKQQLQYYIDLLWDEKLPLESRLSSKELPGKFIFSSAWKQSCFQQASSIVRSSLKLNHQRRYKKYKKIYAECKKERNHHEKFLEKRFSDLKLNKLGFLNAQLLCKSLVLEQIKQKRKEQKFP